MIVSEPKVTWAGMLAKVAELVAADWGSAVRVSAFAAVLAVLYVLVRLALSRTWT